jgi:site-specific recombinase XerD
MVREQQCARVTVQSYANELRAFFRFAQTQGWCAPGLAESIMSPRVFGNESLPSAPSWEQVQTLIATTEGDRPTNIRDRAIVLLLSVYGLRVSEVVRLQLEDIDWQKEMILFRRSKRTGTASYPLCHTVGGAIVRYLREVRPGSAHRDIFLTMNAPFRPLTCSAVWRAVAERLRPIAQGLRHYGPHAIRHACATHLLNEGLSLKEVGDHLGHRSPEATRIYAKVDLAQLRGIAEFDLGELL